MIEQLIGWVTEEDIEQAYSKRARGGKFLPCKDCILGQALQRMGFKRSALDLQTHNHSINGAPYTVNTLAGDLIEEWDSDWPADSEVDIRPFRFRLVPLDT